MGKSTIQFFKDLGRRLAVPFQDQRDVSIINKIHAYAAKRRSPKSSEDNQSPVTSSSGVPVKESDRDYYKRLYHNSSEKCRRTYLSWNLSSLKNSIPYLVGARHSIAEVLDCAVEFIDLLTKSYRRLTIQLLISKKEQAPLKTRLQTVIRKFQTRFADVDVQTVLNNCLSDSQHNLTGLVDESCDEEYAANMLATGKDDDSLDATCITLAGAIEHKALKKALCVNVSSLKSTCSTLCHSGELLHSFASRPVVPSSPSSITKTIVCKTGERRLVQRVARQLVKPKITALPHHMTDSHHGDLRCAVATSLSMSDGLEMHQASFLSRLLTSGTYVKPHSSVRTMVANGVQFSEAQEIIQDRIGDFMHVMTSKASVDFLQHLFSKAALGALLEMYDDLTDSDLPDPMENVAVDVVSDVNDIVSAQASVDARAAELKKILNDAHIKHLLVAHDDIAQENYISLPQPQELAAPPPPGFDCVVEDHRLVTITRPAHHGKPEKPEHLGITVILDDRNDLTIARILKGSLADRQGLLHLDDKVLEVNGEEVFTPEDMMVALKFPNSTITMKIIPSYRNFTSKEQFFVRANFNYDPMSDRLIPCKKVGLPFREGDIMQVVSTADDNWWQARSLSVRDANGLVDLIHSRVSVRDSNGPVGLIPSRALQEKRSAFISPSVNNTHTSLLCGLKVKKMRHIKYNSNNNTELDECDINVYEEVVLTNYHTRVLALVGAEMVGKRSLINRLVKENPLRFQAAIPYTTRPMGTRDVDGHGYFFTDQESMEKDVREGKFLDYGEFAGELYGIKFSTVRAIIKTGRICVFAISPNALKMIKMPDFQPCVVFIAAPSIEAMKVMYEEHKIFRQHRQDAALSKPNVWELFQEEQYIQAVRESQQIEKLYRSYFDNTIVNDDFKTTYTFLMQRLNKLHAEAKWVSVEWKE